MALKTEINILDITNYPLVAEHFERMAAKGWLIDKCVLQNWFIYKRIKPEKLDFSITPYETEKILAEKSKEELEEFKTVCERVGWNYAAKTKDFHIYFKAEGEEAIDLETDDEEELRSLEEIAGRQFKVIYFLIPILALFLFRLLQDISIGFYTFKEIFNPIAILKSGLLQLSILMFPIISISSVKKLYRHSKFIKENKKNLELGKPIEYSDSKFILEKTEILLSVVLLSFLAIQIVFTLIIMKDKRVYRFLIPYGVSSLIVLIYKKTVVRTRKSFDYKFFSFIGTMMLAIGISVAIGMVYGDRIESQGDINISDLQVIVPEDVGERGVKELEKFSKDFSILIPESHDYSGFTEDGRQMETDYTKALTQPIARYVAEKYRSNAEDYIVSLYEERFRYALEKKDYYANERRDDKVPEEVIIELPLEESGLSPQEFESLDKTDIKKALDAGISIMQKKSVKEDAQNLYGADEAYFLNYKKTKLVLRKGKKYLSSKG